jgi:hypothetical protein
MSPDFRFVFFHFSLPIRIPDAPSKVVETRETAQQKRLFEGKTFLPAKEVA